MEKQTISIRKSIFYTIFYFERTVYLKILLKPHYRPQNTENSLIESNTESEDDSN